MTDGSLDGYRRRVTSVLAGLAEVGHRPSARAVLAALGRAGLIAERWDHADDRLGVVLAEELASADQFGMSIAVSLHVETVTCMLRRFASDGLRPYLEGAVDGSLVGCVGASEESGGSELSAVETTATPVNDGWHLTGEKKFVTLSPQADFALVLARLADTGREQARLGVLLVPRDGYDIVQTYRTHGADALDTSRIGIDAVVPAHHLLGRPGLGLAVLAAGLTKERLSISAQVLATCRVALSLAVTRAHERHQFGVRLWDHQAVRLRLAALHAEHLALVAHLEALAGDRAASGRDIAGLKVTAAKFGERCVSECMHIFGGDGYVQGATPLGDLWRAVRLGRIGAGTDEMMWEIVANGLRPSTAGERADGTGMERMGHHG